MKIKDLIAELGLYDEDLEVFVVRRCETGEEEVGCVASIIETEDKVSRMNLIV